MFFLRKSKTDTEPLPMTMSGVRMGERLLQIGVDDPKLRRRDGAKVGLSGSASVAVSDEAAAARARGGAARRGRARSTSTSRRSTRCRSTTTRSTSSSCTA